MYTTYIRFFLDSVPARRLSTSHLSSRLQHYWQFGRQQLPPAAQARNATAARHKHWKPHKDSENKRTFQSSMDSRLHPLTPPPPRPTSFPHHPNHLQPGLWRDPEETYPTISNHIRFYQWHQQGADFSSNAGQPAIPLQMLPPHRPRLCYLWPSKIWRLS